MLYVWKEMSISPRLNYPRRLSCVEDDEREHLGDIQLLRLSRSQDLAHDGAGAA